MVDINKTIEENRIDGGATIVCSLIHGNTNPSNYINQHSYQQQQQQSYNQQQQQSYNQQSYNQQQQVFSLTIHKYTKEELSNSRICKRSIKEIMEEVRKVIT